MTTLQTQPTFSINATACLTPYEVVAYVHSFLSTEHAEHAEHHLQHCDACVDEVLLAARIAAFIESPNKHSVPTSLAARARSTAIDYEKSH